MISDEDVTAIEQGTPPVRAWICHEEPTEEPLIWYESNTSTPLVMADCKEVHPDLPCGWYRLVKEEESNA